LALKAGYPAVVTSVASARKDRKRKAGNEGFYKRGEGIDRMAYFQLIKFSAGTYLALPDTALHTAVVTFNGVGIRRTTLVAASLALKPALTVILYCT